MVVFGCRNQEGQSGAWLRGRLLEMYSQCGWCLIFWHQGEEMQAGVWSHVCKHSETGMKDISHDQETELSLRALLVWQADGSR